MNEYRLSRGYDREAVEALQRALEDRVRNLPGITKPVAMIFGLVNNLGKIQRRVLLLLTATSVKHGLCCHYCSSPIPVELLNDTPKRERLFEVEISRFVEDWTKGPPQEDNHELGHTALALTYGNLR